MNPLAVITGTSSGIGKTLALGLLEKNWDVVGIARREGAIVHENYQTMKVAFLRALRGQRIVPLCPFIFGKERIFLAKREAR